MAEELTKYLEKIGIKCQYIHSDVKTLDRVEILRELRLGIIDVLVGVNLLREGLDLPEVSLVAIMDADKEGFLRNERSLIQTIGRAARNEQGRVLLYANTVTASMKRAISETKRRRAIQEEFNKANNIVPKTVKKSKDAILQQTKIADAQPLVKQYYIEEDNFSLAADPVIAYMKPEELEKQIAQTQKAMEIAAKELNFIEAARLRDELKGLKDLLNSKNGKV
jgi:excinuclease ABC subunit B